jgi:hypothetical protein
MPEWSDGWQSDASVRGRRDGEPVVMGMRLRHALAEALMFTAEACDLLAELLDPQRAPHAYESPTVARPGMYMGGKVINGG